MSAPLAAKFVMIVWLGSWPVTLPASIEWTFTKQNLPLLGYQTRAECEDAIPEMRRLNPAWFIFKCEEVR